MKKITQHRIEGLIENITGLHIGGSEGTFNIGGTDLTVIKDIRKGAPYIPGSSLKGKMRSGLERKLGRFSKTAYRDNKPTQISDPDGDQPCGCAQDNCPICTVFGPHKTTDSKL